jgi:ABC-type lipoprotein export system ATPase subunit
MVTHDHEVANHAQKIIQIRDGQIEKEEMTGGWS